MGSIPITRSIHLYITVLIVMSKFLKFVILTNPRNGSTWIVDVLDNMNDVSCHSELFMNPFYRKERNYKKSQKFKDRLEHSPVWYFYKIKRPFYRRGPFSLIHFLNLRLASEKYAGFKLMIKQMIKHPTTCFYLFLCNVKIIRLKRKNYLDIAISQETMKHRARGHQREPAKQISVYMDLDFTLREIRKCEFWDKVTDIFCKLVPMKVHHVIYEDLKEDEKQWRPLVHFITGEKRNITIQSKYVKSNTAEKRFIIQNYDELYEFLLKKGYGHFF